jgi:hypothetical protein
VVLLKFDRIGRVSAIVVEEECFESGCASLLFDCDAYVVNRC